MMASASASASTSRAIRLSRIHAINWYGYNDTLGVDGHTLLAGVTGSGKSILMDLIQLVLVGTDRALFNRSATGTTSDRTLKSYILCDTKREENGQPQYVRDKGAIAYVALEFTWPKGDRVETWGLRMEFRGQAETQGRVSPFFADGAMRRADFLDAERRPLELAAFRHLVEKERDGRIFETQEHYLRDMANDRHLNFNRAVLGTLLPTAMSFTNLKSFDEFCRRFILPGDRLNVKDVVASYRDFQAYERDLRELQNQLERLVQIHTCDQGHAEAARDQRVARWLAGELARDHAVALLRTDEQELARLRGAFQSEAKRLEVLDRSILVQREEIKRLNALIGQSSEGKAAIVLRSQIVELNREIEQLRGIGNRTDTALRQRVHNAGLWLSEVSKAPSPEKPDLQTLRASIRKLEECPADQSEACLRQVAQDVEQVKIALSRAVRPWRERLEELRKEMGLLREQVDALRLGHLPFPTLLLSALNAALPPDGRQPAAQPLCKLCEVRDETWRPAIEVAFNRKFSVVVSEANYDAALAIYHKLKADSPQESLVNPFRAKPRSILPGSLAEKMEFLHPTAKAVVTQLFGDVICVEKREDLGKHERAILPDGFSSSGMFVERRRQYDGLPFVGPTGLQRQLEIKGARLRDLEAEERQLRPRLEEVDRVLRRSQDLIPEHHSLLKDLYDAQRLPQLEARKDALIQQRGQLDTTAFEKNERAVAALETELASLEEEQRTLLQSQMKGQIEQLEKRLRELQEECERAGRAFERIQAELGDISVHASRLLEWRAEMLAAFPSLEVASRRFETASVEARGKAEVALTELHAQRRELAMAHPRFGDLDPMAPSNEPWEKLRQQIAEARIPEYQAKAVAARKQWEGLFRNQILSKLDRALKDVKNIVFLLNDQLRSPIGNDRYQIETRANPEFKVYRDLISLNAQCQEDELFFAQVSGDLRGALESFLRTLVEQPDGIEAGRLLDYRHYFDYDLLVMDARDSEAKPVSVDRQSGKFSGGENQSPYFVAILASYLRAYNRHETRWRDPSLALVPIDEAFSKLSPERIEDCVRALKQLDLQGLLSMSAGNIPFAFSQCDQLIIVSKHEERRGTRSHIRNVPVCILRDSPEGRQWVEAHG